MNGLKKQGVWIVLIILLGFALYWLVNRDQEVSSKALNDFAIKDTALVDRIFLADNDGNQSYLRRQKDGTWTVNNKWRAKDNNVYLLLRGFYNMEVRSTVPEQAVPAILKQIAAKPIKVEVYLKGKEKPEKIYYFGFATQDHYGNYALLEIPGEGKSSLPYIVKEAGFHGFYRPRLLTREDDWRYSGIFDYPRLQISKVEVDYYTDPTQSFHIEFAGRNNISLYDYQGKEFNQFDTAAVKEYLLLYKKIHIETFNNYLSEERVDSVITQNKPIAKLKVTDREEKVTSVDVYVKGFVNPDLREEQFNYLDPERLYILTSDSLLVIGQKLQWDPLLMPVGVFSPQ
jgi:hypothetical protein